MSDKHLQFLNIPRRDPDKLAVDERVAKFAEIYRRDFIGPKVSSMRVVLERARARGEVSGDVDIDLVAPALPGIVLHRVFLLGDVATPELVARVIDQIILPACSRHRSSEDS